MAHFTYLQSLNCFFHIIEIMFEDQQDDLAGKGICHQLDGLSQAQMMEEEDQFP